MSDELFQRVRVYNGNPFDIHDRHDGVPYEFPAGKAVVIPADVATHIFGFPADDPDMHVYMARRFGWNRPEHYKPDEKGLLPWQALARAVKLTVEKYELKRIRALNEPIPADEAGEQPDEQVLHEDIAKPVRKTGQGKRRAASRARRGRAVPRRQTITPAQPPMPAGPPPDVPLTMASGFDDPTPGS